MKNPAKPKPYNFAISETFLLNKLKIKTIATIRLLKGIFLDLFMIYYRSSRSSSIFSIKKKLDLKKTLKCDNTITDR